MEAKFPVVFVVSVLFPVGATCKFLSFEGGDLLGCQSPTRGTDVWKEVQATRELSTYSHEIMCGVVLRNVTSSASSLNACRHVLNQGCQGYFGIPFIRRLCTADIVSKAFVLRLA
jgi:hypothetical protein